MRKLNLIHHYWRTTTHKLWVLYFLLKFAVNLVWRGIVHDLSKYSWVETKGFIQVIHRLKHTTYDSKEYKENLAKIKPSIDHHQQSNSHHPEYYTNEIAGMNLLDIVEMWCDWNAAVKRHKDGNINNSISTNRWKYYISDDLCSILKNSIK